jgi:hypothetical protein
MDRFRIMTMVIIVGGGLLLMPATPCALSLTKSQDLEFGTFVGGSGYSGTVTIDASGGRHASGNLRLLGSASSPARFALYGTPGESYTITIPASLTMAAGADQMVVSAVTCSVPVSGTVPPSGSLTIALGGTLTVKATQRNAGYLGSFELSVAGN